MFIDELYLKLYKIIYLNVYNHYYFEKIWQLSFKNNLMLQKKCVSNIFEKIDIFTINNYYYKCSYFLLL